MFYIVTWPAKILNSKKIIVTQIAREGRGVWKGMRGGKACGGEAERGESIGGFQNDAKLELWCPSRWTSQDMDNGSADITWFTTVHIGCAWRNE